jgi:hypothetical protein
MISNVAAYAFWLPTLRMRRDRRPAAAFVVEYPCVRFCRIEVELNGERGLVTRQQMQEKADGLHRRIHEPEPGEANVPFADHEAARRPAATVLRSARTGR